MASKLVPLNEAATILGVSPDELNEMRLRQEIYAYRDGASWKFKTEDLDRLQEERAARQGAPLAGSDDDILPVDVDSSSGDDSVLLSELELGESEPSTSSTIIGAAAKVKLPEDSDLKLHTEQPAAGPASDVMLAADSGLKLGGDSGVKLGGDSEIKLGDDDGSVLALGTGSDVPSDLAESQTVVKTSSDMGRSGGSSLIGGVGPSDSGLSLEGDGSGLGLSGGDSALHLADEADDVLGGSGSGSGSDITHRPSDSGILLIDPSDSGLSLDKPLDLAGGSDSLMGETTDFTAESGVSKADDDFLLTPLEEATEDESDSGSQVIMLDTEGEFDDATATLLASQIPGMGSMLEEESPLGGLGGGFGGGPAGEAPGAAAARGPVTAGAGATVMVPMRQEAPFGALTVLGLAACTMTLILGGIMVFDVVRNMWSWDNPYGVDSLLIKNVLGPLGL